MSISSQTQAPTRRKKIIVSAIVIFAIITIITGLKLAKPEPPTPVLKEKLTLVNTGRLTVNTSKPSYMTLGTIRTSTTTDIKSQVTGIIAQTHVENGQTITKDQLLITVNPEEQQRLYYQSATQLAQTQSNLEQATAQHKANLELLEKDKQLSFLASKSLKRYRDLLKRKLATEAQVDQANEIAQRQAQSTRQRQLLVDNWPTQLISLESQLLAAQSQQAQAEADLTNTEIKAPYDGIVHSVMVANGGRITQGAPLLQLYSNSDLMLEASVPDKVIGYLRSQKNASKADSAKALTASAKLWGDTLLFDLKTLSQSASATGGTIGIFKLKDESVVLPANRTVEVQIQIPLLEETYAIPITALHNGQYIYLLNDQNQLTRQDVNLLGETYQNETRFYLIAADNIPVGAMYTTSQMVRDVNGMKVQLTEEA